MPDNGLSPHSPVLLANLAALANRQPELSERLRNVTDLGAARVVQGRDGNDVVLVESTPDADRWLGGSSMPTVSAPAILAGYQERRCSVVLPSIGTGIEPSILADRIDRHRAVFCFEPDPPALALALHVVDLAHDLECGRIVLLCGDIEASLVAFLSANDGYEFPSKLYPLPHVGRHQLEQYTAAIQRAAARIHNQHQQVTHDLARRLTSRSGPRGPVDRPRVAILSIDPGPETAAFADGLQRSMKHLNWPAAVCIPDRPERCSTIARLRTIVNHQPDLLLFVNSTPGEIVELLPSDLPRACWFLESATLPAAALAGLDAAGKLIAASVQVRDQLVSRGGRPADIAILDAGVDVRLFTPTGRTRPEDTRGVGEKSTTNASSDSELVVVLADGFDLSPESAHVALESHVALWRCLVDLLVTSAAEFASEQFGDWLRQAEKKCGVEITDPPVREQFRAVAEHRLSCTLVARSAVEALLAADIDTALFGNGWQAHDALRAAHRGPIPDAAHRRDIYRSARALVLPCFGPQTVQFACEALAVGIPPILRRLPDAPCDNYPQTGPILSGLPSYVRPAELVALLGEVTHRASSRIQHLHRLRSRLIAEHAMSNRLRSVQQALAAARRTAAAR